MATSTKKNVKHPKMDAEIVAGMVLTPIYQKPEGIEGLIKGVTSANDPADALAHMIFSMLSQVRNALMKNNIPIDNNTWLAPGGAVDIIIKDIQGIMASTIGKQLSNKKFAVDVKQDLMKIMKQEMSSANKPPVTAAPGAGGAPMPMQGLLAQQGQPQAPAQGGM